MKGKLSLANVGGVKGDFSSELESGKVNVVEASNSGGKSSVIRALLATLSLPVDGKWDDFSGIEAIRLGLLPGSGQDKEGFVHVHAKEAMVRLETNGQTSEIRISRQGTITVSPGGDQ